MLWSGLAVGGNSPRWTPFAKSTARLETGSLKIAASCTEHTVYEGYDRQGGHAGGGGCLETPRCWIMEWKLPRPVNAVLALENECELGYSCRD